MSSLRIRNVERSDVPSLAVLSSSVGFNQTEEDWRRFVRLEPNGCFIGICDDRIVASSIGISYANGLGWVGMVIVAPDYRRRGYGNTMTSAALEYLEERGCLIVGLDARAAGAPIYRRLGFQSAGPVTRWECRAASTDPLPRVTPRTIRTLQPTDRAQVTTLDHLAFGADRAVLLDMVLSSPDSDGVVVTRNDAIIGFRLSRVGMGPVAVGPIVADDQVTAEEVRALLAPSGTTDGAAVNTFPNERIETMLAEAGFHRALTFQRMYRGPAATARTDGIYRATMGPEFG